MYILLNKNGPSLSCLVSSFSRVPVYRAEGHRFESQLQYTNTQVLTITENEGAIFAVTSVKA